MKKNKPAFTLPEVLLSLAIVGVLAAIAIPQVYVAVNKSQNSAAVNRAAEQLELHNQNMIQNYIAKNPNQAAITTLNEMTNLTVESFAEGLGLTEIEADINDFKLAVTVPTPLFIQAAYAEVDKNNTLWGPGVQTTVGSGNVGAGAGISSMKDTNLSNNTGHYVTCENGNNCDQYGTSTGAGGGGTGGSNTGYEGTGGFTPNVGGGTTPKEPDLGNNTDEDKSSTEEKPGFKPSDDIEEKENLPTCGENEIFRFIEGEWKCVSKGNYRPDSPVEPETPAEPTAPEFYKSYSFSNSDVALYFLKEIDTKVTEPNGVLTHFYIDANGPKGKPNKAGVDLFEYVLLNNGKIRTVND